MCNELNVLLSALVLCGYLFDVLLGYFNLKNGTSIFLSKYLTFIYVWYKGK